VAFDVAFCDLKRREDPEPGERPVLRPHSSYASRVSTKSLQGRQVLALILLALLVVGSGIVAWRVPVPANVPGVAWNSPWVFRGEVFVGFFVGFYVVLAICATTIVSGRPPKKLSFGLLAYEQAELEKAVDALSEGGTALQAVEAEVRSLQQGLNDGLRSKGDPAGCSTPALSADS
jgi:hypothetical protein